MSINRTKPSNKSLEYSIEKVNYVERISNLHDHKSSGFSQLSCRCPSPLCIFLSILLGLCPINITLEGSKSTSIAAFHLSSCWTLLYNGSTGIRPTSDPGRKTYIPIQKFSYTIAYASYFKTENKQCRAIF
ncbi:hypothetical protein I4U23_020357 [Adineta vaga]|nr:hypothetical protein I4U23_020357 [Adineta vaga]